MKCLCAHPRHPGKPCKPSCGCGSFRPSPVPVTPPVLEFDPRGEDIAAREAASA